MIRLRWRLFASRERRSGYVAKGYVAIFTHDGQVHHAWDQQRFVAMVPERSRVAAGILVEIDTDAAEALPADLHIIPERTAKNSPVADA